MYIDTVPKIVYQEIENRILPSFDTIIKSKNGLSAKIWMQQGKLYANLELDSIFYMNLKDSIRAEIEQQEVQTTIITKEERSVKDWLKIGLIILISVLGLILVGWVIKFVKWINQ